MTTKQLATYFKKYRQKHNLTKKALAKEIGISPGTLALIEEGIIGKVSDKTKEKIIKWKEKQWKSITG